MADPALRRALRTCGLVLPGVITMFALGGCGIPGSVSAENRPDVTAVPPPAPASPAAATRHASKPTAHHRSRLHRPSAAAWVTMHDSGVRFALRQQVTPRVQTIDVGPASIHSRIYVDRGRTGLDLVVAVQTITGAEMSASQLDSVGVGVVAASESVGNEAAQLVSSRAVVVEGRPARDITVRFRHSGQTVQRTCLVRTVLDGERVINVVSVENAYVSDAQLHGLFDHATRSLQLG